MCVCVTVFVCLLVCLDFSGEDKTSGVNRLQSVKFRTVVHRRLSILGNFAPSEAQNRTNRRAASGRRIGMCG